MHNIEELIANTYNPQMDEYIAGLSDKDLCELFLRLNNHSTDQETFHKIKAIAFALEHKNRKAINQLQFDAIVYLSKFMNKDIFSCIEQLNTLTTFSLCAVAAYLCTKDPSFIRTWIVNVPPILNDDTTYTWAEKVLLTMYLIEHR